LRVLIPTASPTLAMSLPPRPYDVVRVEPLEIQCPLTPAWQLRSPLVFCVVQYGAVCCSVLSCAVVCCRVLPCAAVRCRVFQCICNCTPSTLVCADVGECVGASLTLSYCFSLPLTNSHSLSLVRACALLQAPSFPLPLSLSLTHVRPLSLLPSLSLPLSLTHSLLVLALSFFPLHFRAHERG